DSAFGLELEVIQTPLPRGPETLQRHAPILSDSGEDARLHRPGDASETFPALCRHRQIRPAQPRLAGVHRSAGGAVDEEAVFEIPGKRSETGMTWRVRFSGPFSPIAVRFSGP